MVDDADSVETCRQVEAFARRARARVMYLPVRESHGPAAARNIGWRAARGAVVAFTDDDCVPDYGWLNAGLAPFERDNELAAVAGRLIVPVSSKPTDYERDAAGLESGEFVTANCFCRRSVLIVLGGFDERFSAAWREDSDLHFRLLKCGAKIVKAPDAVVRHPVRPAPWGISLKQQRKVLFDALLYKKHPELYRRHIRPRPLWSYYAIVAALVTATGLTTAGLVGPALVAWSAWALLTGRFCAHRLRDTLHTPRHVAEMTVTSVLIPCLSVFWRQYGALKFRVLYL